MFVLIFFLATAAFKRLIKKIKNCVYRLKQQLVFSSSSGNPKQKRVAKILQMNK